MRNNFFHWSTVDDLPFTYKYEFIEEGKGFRWRLQQRNNLDLFGEPVHLSHEFANVIRGSSYPKAIKLVHASILFIDENPKAELTIKTSTDFISTHNGELTDTHFSYSDLETNKQSINQ
jgi:hypothetical protein